VTVTYFQTTGLEELVDDVEEVLLRDINDALATVYERRALADEARALRRGVGYVPLTYDEVPSDHFHVGNFPRLSYEEVDYEAYPYIVLTVEDYVPDPEDATQDHRNVYRDALVVHCLAASSSEEGGEVVWRRAVRMGEAVFLALASDPMMQRRLSGVSNPVRGQHSIPWTHKRKGRGEVFWFQAVGTHYAIKNYTSMHQ
jgi:hypothetical protein